MKAKIFTGLVPLILMLIFGVEIKVLSAQPIKLAWDLSVNPDVSHYAIYRSNQIDSSFTLLTTIMHPENTFSDEQIQNGMHYYYAATSIDKLGNESGFSNVIDTVVTATTSVSSTIFSVRTRDNDAILEWSVLTANENFNFELQRSDNAFSSFKTIAIVAGKNQGPKIKQYSYVDKNLNNGRYYYRLKQVDLQGQFEYSDVLEAVITMPDQVKLFQNFPNPFNSATTISYYLPQSSHVEVIIYNMQGQVVNRLVDSFQEKGQKAISWNGSDHDANAAPSGIYYYKINALNYSEYRRMILLK